MATTNNVQRDISVQFAYEDDDDYAEQTPSFIGAYNIRGDGQSTTSGARIVKNDGSILYSSSTPSTMMGKDKRFKSLSNIKELDIEDDSVHEMKKMKKYTPSPSSTKKKAQDVKKEPSFFVKETDKKKMMTGHCVVMSILIMTLIGAGILLAVVFLVDPSKKNSTSALSSDLLGPPTPQVVVTSSPTFTPPTASPITSPAPTTETNGVLVEMLSSYLPDITSPSVVQQQALDWLASDASIVTTTELIQTGDADRLLDRFVMAVLYLSTTGEGWIQNGDGWMTDTDVCSWATYDPYICSSSTDEGNGGRVDHINLRSYLLRGTIPTELGTLSQLTYLRFTENQLVGTLPTEIAQLTALTWLDVFKNRLTGTIPTVYGDMASLERLYLSRNKFVGTIPTELGRLTSMKRLLMEDNDLTGSIPTEFANYGDLVSLWLYDNPNLTGNIPVEVETILPLNDCMLGCYPRYLQGIPDFCLTCGRADNMEACVGNC